MTYGLIILDGFGKATDISKSAIDKANKPFIDSLLKNYPNTLINASGEAVGLPQGQMGNSEVGHLNIGAGRIVYQELLRIGNAIKDGSFNKVAEFNEAIEKAKANNGILHIFGLLSDGGVHSHITHIMALLDLAKEKGVKQAAVHCFTDGRDVAPTSGIGYVQQLQEHIEKIGFGEISTIIGRYYAMDRDNRWERVQIAYDALTLGEGEHTNNPCATMQKRYDNNETDEFLKPIICGESFVKEGDSVIFANFRPDRARQITRAFTWDGFDSFERKVKVRSFFVCMTEYDVKFKNVSVAFKPEHPKNTFGEYISNLNLKQLRIAETEKYPHVTFFFNGGIEEPNKNEDRVLIPSPKVATYDLQPEMSAYLVADKAAELIPSYDVLILNFANPDMVGHTGVMEAAVKAVEAVDKCAEKVVNAILQTGGKCIVTADHGNADIMIDDDGRPFTAHTTNLVPFIVVGEDNVKALKEGGKLCDVMPTLLDMMGIDKPKEMTAQSLIVK
ncbi:MAG: 2,3-bisphosphoglycerate-independent phosphoglycerate mutase [Clostridia bacterium]|nr:2,3-bisphosphoglycerate-independent phosphoglycerate mutase [Clostridia bacterium]